MQSTIVKSKLRSLSINDNSILHKWKLRHFTIDKRSYQSTFIVRITVYSKDL